jgi:hypothetical protein
MKPHNVIPLFGEVKKPDLVRVRHLKKTVPEMEQLSLPFLASHSLMMVMASDFNSVDKFSRFISAVITNLILDMRIAPRLDFIGTNRAHSFSVLKSLNIEYKDMLGRTEIKSYEGSLEKYHHLWESLVTVLGPIQVRHQPIVLFFDNSQFMSLCCRSLSSIYDVILMSSEDINSIILKEPLRM